MPIIIELIIITTIPTIFKLINLAIDMYFPKKRKSGNAKCYHKLSY